MNLILLDTINEKNSTCYLCKARLSDYIKSIPDDYLNWDIQRGIVNNKYLDHIADTISNKMHIPPIVLVTNSEIDKKENSIEINGFKVLDGLQRTHRFIVIFKSIRLIIVNRELYQELNNDKLFCRKMSKQIKEISSTSKLILRLLNLNCIKLADPIDFFQGNDIWLEIWTGLDENDQVRKMLLLNAGHKSVNIKHQLELLFFSTKQKIEDSISRDIHIIREKDQSAIVFSKNRKLGDYHFSHIISSLISLYAGKIVNTNSDFVSDLQVGEMNYIDINDSFDFDVLKEFIETLNKLDKSLYSKYKEIGIKWIGREVVLVGLFGAIGAYINNNDLNVKEYLKYIGENSNSIAIKLDLFKFEDARNSVEINRVNIGNVNKKAVFNAVYDILDNKDFKKWTLYFNGTVL